jgi:hypothetical protein
MEGHAEKALFILTVDVLNSVSQIDECFHLVGLRIVRPNVDGAVFRAGEDSVRAIACAHDEERARVARAAHIETAKPVGPFKLWEGGYDVYQKGPLVYFSEDASGERCV